MVLGVAVHKIQQMTKWELKKIMDKEKREEAKKKKKSEWVKYAFVWN